MQRRGEGASAPHPPVRKKAERSGRHRLHEVTKQLLQCKAAGQWQRAQELFRNAGAESGVQVDIIALGLVMAAAKEGRGWQPALALQQEALERALEPNQVTSGTLMSSFSNENHWMQALSMWSHIGAGVLGTVGANAATSACQAQWQIASLILQTEARKRTALDIVSFNTAASCATWADAIQLLAAASEAKLRRSIVGENAALSASSDGPGWRFGLAIFGLLLPKGLTPSTVTLNAAGTLWVRVSSWPRASSMMQEMVSGVAPYTPDLISHNVLLNALDRAVAPRSALDLLMNMARRKLRPNVVSFGSAASACSRGVLWTSSLSLLAEMVARGMHPSDQLRNAVISACSRSTLWQLSGLLLSSQEKVDEAGHVAGISAFEEAARWRDALASLRLARKSLLNSGILFVTACSACSQGRRWESAVLLWKAMRAAGAEPDVAAYGALLQALVSSNVGHWQKAVQVRAEMAARKGVTLRTALVNNFALTTAEQVRQWPCSLQLHARAQQAGLAPDVNTFGVLVGCLQVKSQWVRSVGFLQELALARLSANELHLGAAVGATEASGVWPMASMLLQRARWMRLHPGEAAYGAALQAASGDPSAWFAALALAEDLAQFRLLPMITLLAFRHDALERGLRRKSQAANLGAMQHEGARVLLQSAHQRVGKAVPGFRFRLLCHASPKT
ncbi:EMB2654 [Symbiodinium sp. CCMP2592]|nr:EMB2654 [Symbiodinium sp. CCMP2592]